ncbi:MAG: hypothetical protein IKU29_00215 [Parabacteroides sp.]|nr:hypothetical protein [Parabacteroides sp.]
MMKSDMDTQLNYEQSQQLLANKFYKDHFNSDTTRYDWGDDYGRSMQRRDIDCSISINGEQVNISEKFRREDWGDIWIELYSSYPNTLGWALTGRGVDYLTYFTKKKYTNENQVYVVKHCIIEKFAQQMYKFFTDNVDIYNELKTKNRVNKVVEVDGKLMNVWFTKSVSTRTINGKTSEWTSYGACIKWSDIKDYELYKI